MPVREANNKNKIHLDLKNYFSAQPIFRLLDFWFTTHNTLNESFNFLNQFSERLELPRRLLLFSNQNSGITMKIELRLPFVWMQIDISDVLNDRMTDNHCTIANKRLHHMYISVNDENISISRHLHLSVHYSKLDLTLWNEFVPYGHIGNEDASPLMHLKISIQILFIHVYKMYS